MKQTRRVIFGLGTLVLIFSLVQRPLASAQFDPSRVIRLFPRSPAMIVKIPATERPVTIKRMAVKVEISGLETETTTEITFHNPNARVLEGQLEFPLPNDAVVTGYALDVNGKMIDGVIVPKDKARVVLETEIRRGVDPGLVEHVKGNVFRTRLYPLPASGDRTVKITSVAPLVLYKEDAAMQLSLPLGEKIDALAVEVKVSQPQGAPPVTPAVTPQIGGFGNLTFTKWQNEWVAKTAMKDVTPDKDIFINLPSLPARIVTVEKVDKFGGDHFVAISDRPSERAAPSVNPPSKIAIAWDASGSRKPESVRKEQEFLRAVFNKWRSLEVELIVFRNTAEAPQAFAVRDGKAPELFKALDELAYDGGTALHPLNFMNAKGGAREWLLFSDGLVTLGEELPRFGGGPVHVISSSTLRDSALQQFLANATGGRYIDLTVGDAGHAAALLTAPQVSLLRIEAPPGVIDSVQSQFMSAAGRANVYAKLKGDGKVTLVYGVGSREVSRTEVALTKTGAASNELVARAWASLRAKELGVFADKNAVELLELGRKYGLVTPGASLIVLETVAQYLEHEIMPPANMPEWREQYLAQLKHMQYRQRTDEASKIDQVVNLWQQRVNWWERKFPRSYQAPQGGPYSNFGGRRAVVANSGRAASPNQARPQAPSAAKSAAVSSARDSNKGAGELADSTVRAKSRALGVADKGEDGSARIAIKEWNPATPYLEDIQREVKSKGTKGAYASYLNQRSSYGSSPGFFLDCATFFFKHDRALAVRILSNLAEMKLEDPALLRVFAWRLSEAGDLDGAVEILEKVRRLRPEEPQSDRDLALALAQRMDKRKSPADGLRSARLLYDVIVGPNTRFAEIETIAIMELNHLLERLEKLDPKAKPKVSYVDQRLRKLLELDVRITMSWDADATDLDLHVVEPSGEEAYYAHNLTTIGGLVSRDITVGYGPEEYVIRRAMPGTYKIMTKYYGSRQQTLLGPATVTATVITNFGRPNEKRELLTLRLNEVKGVVEVGSITIGGEGSEKLSTLTRDKLASIKRGMSEAEVIKALGEPERRDGGALTVFLYRLSDGTQLRIGFGPVVLWVREVLENAERDLL